MPIEIISAIIGAVAVVIGAIISAIVAKNKNNSSTKNNNNLTENSNPIDKPNINDVIFNGDNNIVGNSNTIIDNRKQMIVKKNKEAKIHIVSTEFIQDSNGFFIDIKLRNSGDKIAFIKKIKFIIYDYYAMKDPKFTQYSLMEPTAIYDVVLNDRKHQSFSLSQIVEGNNVDRFKIRVANSLCDAQMVTLYHFSYVLFYNEDNSKSQSAEYVAAVPSEIEWVGSFSTGLNKEIAKQNYLQLKRFNNYPCIKSSDFIGILNSYDKNKGDFM